MTADQCLTHVFSEFCLNLGHDTDISPGLWNCANVLLQSPRSKSQRGSFRTVVSLVFSRDSHCSVQNVLSHCAQPAVIYCVLYVTRNVNMSIRAARRFDIISLYEWTPPAVFLHQPANSYSHEWTETNIQPYFPWMILRKFTLEFHLFGNSTFEPSGLKPLKANLLGFLVYNLWQKGHTSLQVTLSSLAPRPGGPRWEVCSGWTLLSTADYRVDRWLASQLTR